MRKSAEGWTLQRCVGTNKIWHLSLLLFTSGVREVWSHQSSPLLSMYSKWFFSGGIQRERAMDRDGGWKKNHKRQHDYLHLSSSCLLTPRTHQRRTMDPFKALPAFLTSQLMIKVSSDAGSTLLTLFTSPSFTTQYRPRFILHFLFFIFIFHLSLSCLWGACETDLEKKKKRDRWTSAAPVLEVRKGNDLRFSLKLKQKEVISILSLQSSPWLTEKFQEVIHLWQDFCVCCCCCWLFVGSFFKVEWLACIIETPAGRIWLSARVDAA